MKKLFWAIASIFIAGVSIWAVAFQQKNFSFGDFFEFALNSHPAWLIGAVLCMFGFIWFEGNALRRVACSLGHRTSFLRGTVYGAADVYFSAITPSATGGQPASAYFMLADGIPGPVVTVCLIINLVMYTLALLTVGLFSLICYFDVFLKFSLISQVLIVIGVVIQIALAIGFVLLLKKPQILYGFMTKVMVLLEKMHLLRHGQKKRDKLNRTIDEYAECAQMITGHRRMLIELFGWNLLQRISQVSVTLMAFMATGHSLATSWRAWVTQCCAGTVCTMV